MLDFMQTCSSMWNKKDKAACLFGPGKDGRTTVALRKALITPYWFLLFWWISSGGRGVYLIFPPLFKQVSQLHTPRCLSVQHIPFRSHLHSYHWQLEGKGKLTFFPHKISIFKNLIWVGQSKGIGGGGGSPCCREAILIHFVIHHSFTTLMFTRASSPASGAACVWNVPHCDVDWFLIKRRPEGDWKQDRSACEGGWQGWGGLGRKKNKTKTWKQVTTRTRRTTYLGDKRGVTTRGNAWWQMISI